MTNSERCLQRSLQLFLANRCEVWEVEGGTHGYCSGAGHVTETAAFYLFFTQPGNVLVPRTRMLPVLYFWNSLALRIPGVSTFPSGLQPGGDSSPTQTPICLQDRFLFSHNSSSEERRVFQKPLGWAVLTLHWPELGHMTPSSTNAG